MSDTIGFDRFIDLVWLNKIANLSNESMSLPEIRACMEDFFMCKCSGYEAQRKTITVLTRIWIRAPERISEFHSRAAKLFQNVHESDKIWLHWGMTLVAYPFFKDVVTILGRLLSLYGEVTSRQVLSRIHSKWGENSTVTRAVSRVLQSLISWQIINVSAHNGMGRSFVACGKHTTNNLDLQLWLIEALLRSGEDYLYLPNLVTLNPLFPFTFKLSSSELRKYYFFEFTRSRLNSEVLTINDIKGAN